MPSLLAAFFTIHFYSAFYSWLIELFSPEHLNDNYEYKSTLITCVSVGNLLLNAPYFV